MAVLAKLLDLRSLLLWGTQCQWPAAASAAYTALAASSKLTRLHLTDCDFQEGVWQQVFTPGRLTDLQELETWHGEDGDYPRMHLITEDMKDMVKCCPSLRKLSLTLHPGTDCSAVSQLSALSALDISGASAAGVRASTTLTSLVDLQLRSTDDAVVQYSWLLPLTALRQLTRLLVFASNNSDVEDASESVAVDVALEHKDPSVRVQLVKVLAERSSTAPLVTSSLAQELAQAQQQVGAMQKQLDDAHKQLSMQHQQLAQQSAQLKAQQQAAVQQSMRIVQLEQQLAEQQVVRSQ